MSDNGLFDSEVEPDPAERVKTQLKVSVVSVVISVLLLGCVTAGLVVMGRTRLVPTWAFAVILVADVVLACVAVVLLMLSGPTRHKVRFWLTAVLSVVLAVGNLGMVKAGMDYLDFTSGIQPQKTDTVLYDIVVPVNGPDQVSQLSQSVMGEVQDDPLSVIVHGQVLQRVQVNFLPSPTWSDMVTSLTNADVASMVIQDGFMQVLSDADPDTYATLKIIDSFEVDSSLASTPSPTPSAKPVTTNSYVLYISGIDTTGSISNRSRSDVNILMVVNPDKGRVLLVNTPRDYYVSLHGRSGLPDKLTHAGVYGIDVSVGTLEDLYDITIDYYVRINFTSLVTVIDALGGVDVDSAYDFSIGGYDFHVGTNHLDGAAALAFSRDRHDFAGGDRVRGQNQQRVIVAIINKITQPSVLLNYPQIMSSVQDSIQTSMSQDAISAQVKQQLSTGTKWDVTSISVDGTGAMDFTYSYPGQRLYVMVPDQSTVDLAKDQIQATLNGQ